MLSGFIITAADKHLLDEYKALGTPAQIRAILGTDDGYAPLPMDLNSDEFDPVINRDWEEK